MQLDRATELLKQAIALHEKHMAGTAPTTGAAGMRSQQEMMDMMKGALSALGGGQAPAHRMGGMNNGPRGLLG